MSGRARPHLGLSAGGTGTIVAGVALAYLNRLGDLLFNLARVADAPQGFPPRLWRSGAGTEARAAERILPEPNTA